MSPKHDEHFQHISQRFNTELKQLIADFLAMGQLVEDQIGRAMQALENRDAELAAEVVATDRDVDLMERQLDVEAHQVIVKRQPAGSDFRLVISVLKMVSDLERIGDEAQKVAQYATSLSKGKRHSRVPETAFTDARKIARSVSTMVQESMQAFSGFDTELALQILKKDERVDKKHKQAIRALVTHMADNPRAINPCLSIIWVLRSLERIGDHACNIAEHVIFLVEGDDVRHTPMAEKEKLVRK